jgi:glycosyltransferase involved in cell wall biosynthesis
MEREREEWALSDVIFCGSEFVRDGIGAVGGPVEKCRVVPYGFGFSGVRGVVKEVNRDRPLRVLFMGTVCLRKGMAEFVRVAEALRGRMTFRVVGPETLLPEAGARLRRSAEVPGPVPRAEVGGQYEWADVFLFPSHCEGSATVCYEALAHGVPVICTPNTGSVVRDGVEGFIVEAGDVEAMVSRLERLDAGREELAALSAGALARRGYFGVEAYEGRLREVLGRLDGGSSAWTGEMERGKERG